MNTPIKTLSLLGSGWLGLPLAKHFISLGYQVNASTRSAERLSELAVTGIQPFIVDIDQLDQLDNALAEFLDANILIINITSKNLAGFAQLISQIEQSPVKHVLFVSSTSVYQNLNREVSENHQAELANSPLLQIEQLFTRNPHFSTTILRFSGLIGYRRHPGRFFGQGKVVSQADAPVNLIHRDDCIGIIDAIIEQQVWGVVFNGCADTHPSKREFYTYARQLLGMPAPEFADDTEQAFKIVSNAKVKQVLDYQFKYPDVMDIDFD